MSTSKLKNVFGVLDSNRKPSSLGQGAKTKEEMTGDLSDDDFDLEVKLPTPKRSKHNNLLKNLLKKKQEKEIRKRQADDDLELDLALRTAAEAEDEALTCSQEAVQERVHQAKEDQKQAAVIQGRVAPRWQEPLIAPAEIAGHPLDFDCELQRGVAKALTEDGHDAEDLRASDLGAELLTDGWLLGHYLRAGACPANVSRSLFEAIYAHEDDAVCSAALRAFCALCGGSDSSSLRLAGAASGIVPWKSILHPAPKDRGQCLLKWLPGTAAFVAAFAAVGVPFDFNQGKGAAVGGRKGGKGKGKGRGKAAAVEESEASTEAEAEDAPETRASRAGLHRLGLLLRALAIRCGCPLGSPADTLAAPGELLLALLRLHTDPAAPIYCQDLRAAVDSLIHATPTSDWAEARDAIATRLDGALPSHSSTVHVLQQLPIDTGRGWELQRRAAMHAIGPALERSAQECAHEAVSEELGFVLNLLGDASDLAKMARARAAAQQSAIGRNQRGADFWAVSSALRLADMVFWKAAKEDGEASLSQHGEDDEGEAAAVHEHLKRWGELLQRAGRHVRATSQDESENQARLLLAELSSYYDFLRRQHLFA